MDRSTLSNDEFLDRMDTTFLAEMCKNFDIKPSREMLLSLIKDFLNKNPDIVINDGLVIFKTNNRYYRCRTPPIVKIQKDPDVLTIPKNRRFSLIRNEYHARYNLGGKPYCLQSNEYITRRQLDEIISHRRHNMSSGRMSEYKSEMMKQWIKNLDSGNSDTGNPSNSNSQIVESVPCIPANSQLVPYQKSSTKRKIIDNFNLNYLWEMSLLEDEEGLDWIDNYSHHYLGAWVKELIFERDPQTLKIVLTPSRCCMVGSLK